MYLCALQALHEQMAVSVHEISNLIEPVAVAARSEASHLGHKVKHRTHYKVDIIRQLKEDCSYNDMG